MNERMRRSLENLRVGLDLASEAINEVLACAAEEQPRGEGFASVQFTEPRDATAEPVPAEVPALHAASRPKVTGPEVPRACHRWMSEEEVVLRTLYPTAPDLDELARAMGRTKDALTQRAHQLNISRRAS